MKFTFIVPDSPFLTDEKVFPFLGPLYLSAVLKQAGHEVTVIDLVQNQEIPPIEADYVGITATTPQFPRAVEILNTIKNRYPFQKVIIGGPHASANPEECARYFDMVCVGEGEDFVKDIERARSPHAAASYGKLEDLDSIPFPDREAIDMSKYHYFIDEKRTTSILTSRGCPYNCAFCCKEPWGRGIRYRSALNVIEEIDILANKYEGLMLYDDEFFLNSNRDTDIIERLGQKGMVWRCFSRSDIILKKEGLIKFASQNGLKEILIGCESGSNDILQNINKGTTVAMNKEAIKLLKSMGVRVKAALIIGLPGETPDTIMQTETFCKEVEPDSVDFTVLRVLPGSDIHNNPEKYDLKFKPSYDPYKTKPGEYTAGVSTKAMTAKDILDARDYLDKIFNPQYYKEATK
jgi:anaerobic magnesium-protoporphyrin IX monomethyl ester cyclase